jgi:hypothetical protein
MFETEDFLSKNPEGQKETPQEIKAERTRSPLETPEEELLETRENTTSSWLEGGINEACFIELKDDGSGIFKPGNGENKFLPERNRPLRKNAEAGTYYLRERAAYLVDKFLGFDLIPPTVIRTINGAEGSFQQFVPDAETLFARELVGTQWKRKGRKERERIKGGQLQGELLKLWIFDYIIYNSDRHGGNFLVKDDKVYAIDNGLAFAPDKLRRNYGKFWDVSIPDELKEKFESFLSQEDKQKVLKDLLSELLKPGEVEACLGRIETIGRIIASKGSITTGSKKELKFQPKK